MKLVIKATCDHCKTELARFQVNASVNSAISQIKTGEFDESVKNLICSQHPTAAILCIISLGTYEVDTWTKRFDRTEIPPSTGPSRNLI